MVGSASVSLAQPQLGEGAKQPQLRRSADAPETASAEASEQNQTAFESPVNNKGAFTRSIPIPVPPGIPGMTPELALSYSSMSGVGIAGVGWDMPYPAITVDNSDGFRLGSIADDLERFPPDVAVERYISNFGKIAVIRDEQDYETSTRTYVVEPHADQKVEPIPDEQGRYSVGGDKAAWLITTKDGTSYRYGYSEQASIYRDKGDPPETERKVAWLLDQVEDRHGNLMRYYYEQYPNRQLGYRHPVLRAIAYGIPARSPSVDELIVVLFDYVESPWKRFSYQLGTRLDHAFVLDRVCGFANAVIQSVTFSGEQGWDVLNADQPTGDMVPAPCLELAYDFEEGNQGYTGRPLLMAVQQVAPDGERRPPWRMSYRHQEVAWQSVYANSLSNPGTWTPPVANGLDQGIQYTTHDLEHMAADVSGDGILDVIHGRPDGAFDVYLGGISGLESDTTAEPWPNPLFDARPIGIVATENKFGETTGSACWYKADFNLGWEPALPCPNGQGCLGFAEAVTNLPEDYWTIFTHNWNEREALNLPLGAFQFLRSSYYGPYPAFAKKDAFTQAKTIDQLESYGSRANSSMEQAFSNITSDCRDFQDKWEIDHCWNVGPRRDGMLGADHDCLDFSGARWFTDTGWEDTTAGRSYSSVLWEPRDMDADGILDLVFGAHVIAQKDDGTQRDFAAGANDWYWARGTGQGWETPVRWRVPPTNGAKLGLGGEVDFVYGTEMLSTSVSTTATRAAPPLSIGLSVSVAPGSAMISPAIAVGGMGVPTSAAGTARTALNLAAGTGFSNMSPRSALVAKNLMQAVQAVIGLAQSGALSLLPSFTVASGDSSASWWLPIVGDVLAYLNTQSDIGDGYAYQGLLDLDGDGRDDLVSARWDAGSSRNAGDRWLFYRNNGSGFDDPELFRFTQEPPATAYASGALSGSVNMTFRKRVFDGGPQDLIFGVNETYYALVDLNGDGLGDYVDAHNWEELDDNGNPRQTWWVHFNEGNRFGEPMKWVFEGDWDSIHGPQSCSYVHGQPHVAKGVFGNPTYANGGHTYTREVQGLLDINGDGRLDFWYEEPYYTDGVGSSCGHLVSDSGGFGGGDGLRPYVEPYQLKRRLLVRLNTGHGFGLPIEWIGNDGYALGGGDVDVLVTEVPAERRSSTVLGTGDFDNDGALELAVRDRYRDANEDPHDDPSRYDWKLFDLAEPNVDVLAVIVNPTGGRLEVTYKPYVQPADGLPMIPWVVDSLRMTDYDPSHLDVIQTYSYEHAVWDRDFREFRGFERIYETSDDGYTLSRYYVNEGFDGRLYCREVRALDDAQQQIDALISDHADAWLQAQTIPAGHTLPVAVGRPIGGAVGSTPWPAEDEQADPDPPNQAGGSTADSTSPWGTTPADSPPDNDFDEGLTWEADGPAPPDPPDYPDDGNQQWGYDAGQHPPLDSGLPGETETPDLDDTPPGDWWDLSVYDDCPSGGSTVVDGVVYYCDGDDIPLDLLSCGDKDDPGIPVEHQYHIWGDGSGIQGWHAPKLRAGAEYLFARDGLNPRITSWSNEIDGLGNEVARKDLGDVAVTGDEHIRNVEYASSTDAYLVDFPCHERIETGTSTATGTLLRESWTGYDGAPADGTCAPVTKGNATEVKHAVSAAESIIETFAYSQEGLIWLHRDGKSHTTTSIYSQRYPWLKVAEMNPVVAYDGPKLLAKLWVYYGTDNAPRSNFGRLYREVSYGGAVTEYLYDGFDRPAAVTRPLDDPLYPGSITEYVEWDEAQEPAKVVEHSLVTGNLYSQETKHLDGWQRVKRLEVTAPTNQYGCLSPSCWAVGEEKVYDLDGRETESRLPYFSNEPGDDLRLLTDYDLLGRVTRVQGPSGAETVIAYDRASITVRDPDGILLVTEKDAKGNPILTHSYIDGGATHYATTERTYDTLGQLERILDARGNEWRFEYDLLGRQTLEHDPNAGDKVLVFDANGNLAVSYDARYATQGLATQLLYDPIDRPVYRLVQQNATVSGTSVSGGDLIEESIWAYDVDPGLLPDATISACAGAWRGQLTRAETYRIDNGARVLVSRKDYCHDDRGRVLDEHLTVHGGHLYSFSYSYTQADRIAQATYPDGDQLTYDYDARGNLIGIASAQVGRILDGADFSAGGLPVARVLGAGAIDQKYCYEAGKSGFRLSEAVTGQSGTTLACDGSDPSGPFQHWARYDYSPSGSNRLDSRSVNGAVAHSYAFQYDPLGRLEGEIYDGASAGSFAYDEIGNLTDMGGVTQTYGDAARSTNNAGPNAILRTSSGVEFAYDPAGNVRSIQRGGSRYQITSDARNFPRSIRRNGQLVGRYLYDASGARVQKISGGIETRYAGPFRESSHRTETVYPGIGVKVTDLAGAHALYFTLSDTLGSAVMTLDTAGNPVQAVGYEPYGKVRYETLAPNGYDNDRLYNGKEREAAFAAGMSVYDYGPRLYFSNVGRWLSLDTSFADGPNRYAYVSNNPVNYSDPTGRGTSEAWDGQDAHRAISAYFLYINPTGLTDESLNRMARTISPGASRVPLIGGLLRPDLVLPAAHGNPNYVWEIKSLTGTVQGILEAAGYSYMLNWMTGQQTDWGPMFHSGTYGIVKGNRGYYVYFTPTYGVVTYQKIPSSQAPAILWGLIKSNSPADFFNSLGTSLYWNPEIAVVAGGLAILEPGPFGEIGLGTSVGLGGASFAF